MGPALPLEGDRIDSLPAEEAPQAPTRLLLVDEHELIRIGLVSLFSTEPDFQVVGEASGVREAVDLARRLEPDVIILEVRLPDGSGVHACREIRSERPETRVLMLTSYADEEAVVASILAGAAGYVLKQIQPSRLVRAVRQVAQGVCLLDPRVTSSVLKEMRRLSEHPADLLSPREQRILPLIAEGKTNREIAQALCVSENTVKAHVSHILHKLGLHRRAEAAAFVARRGVSLSR